MRIGIKFILRSSFFPPSSRTARGFRTDSYPVVAGTLSPGIKTEEICGNEDIGCHILRSAVEVVVHK